MKKRRDPPQQGKEAIESLLTREEVAQWLSVTEQCLRRWATKGVGPPFVKIGYWVRYRREDIEKWIEQGSRNRPVSLV